MEKPREKNNRLEVWIAVLIALVSLTTALAAWRTTSLGSKAGDLIYQGLLDAVKRQAAANEDWRKAYEEAGYTRDYLITLDGLIVQGNSNDPASQEHAAQLRTYLLPGMKSLATPLGTDPSYLTPDGWLNVQKRFDELEAQSSDLSSLDPLASFSLADTYYAEQRWLVVGTILIAVSLFWLGLSQLSHLRSRILILVLGVIVYGIGLVWSLGVEAVFFILRGGVL
ncbi:MAG TPA: hypothetical protein VII97_02295 [Anaerolineales bacterium]